MTDEPLRPPVAYILVRKDMPAKHQVVHVGHASAESIRVAPIPKTTIRRVLWVADETELRAYAEKLSAKGFHIALVLETDGPFAGQATALGVEPMTERLSALSKLVYHLDALDL